MEFSRVFYKNLHSFVGAKILSDIGRFYKNLYFIPNLFKY